MERAPKVKKLVPAQIEERKIEVFTEGSAQFEDALQKVSKGLLDVLHSQFGSKPESFVVGGIVEDKRKDGSSAVSESEDSMSDIFEEDEDSE